MNTKEKAEELLKKFDLPTGLMSSERKECALIAANEIIEQWEYIDTYLANGMGTLNPNLKYWQEVITELNKL